MPVEAGLERTTVVAVADWPIMAILLSRGEPAAEAVAAAFHANRVIASTPAAVRAGVVPGLRRREAQRRAPDLTVEQRDLTLEARVFERVLRGLDDITPRVEVETPGWCSFATRGPSRYHGGDRQMSEQVQAVVAELIEESGWAVGVGTADTRFAALQAALRAPGRVTVVDVEASAAFLAPLPVAVLDDPDLADVLIRLGIITLGDLAALPEADVVGRFGAAGLVAHHRAAGREQRLADRREPPADLIVGIELDPPIERVDQAAFVARTLADEFCRLLGGQGITCAQVAIVAETEHGEELLRLWRGEGALSAGAIADRTRWQLDGWLNGSARSRPTGGLSRLELRPDVVMAAVGRQLGFWGGETQEAARAARAVARIQGLIGPQSVTVPETAGGRSADQAITMVPAEAVDLVERGCETAPHRGLAHEGSQDQPWPGRLPAPLPIVVFDPMRPTSVFDGDGATVRIDGRGLLSSPPAWLDAGPGSSQGVEIVAWAGPWLIDERWWDTEGHRRRARFQVVTSDGRARLVTCERGEWFTEAIYD